MLTATLEPTTTATPRARTISDLDAVERGFLVLDLVCAIEGEALALATNAGMRDVVIQVDARAVAALISGIDAHLHPLDVRTVEQWTDTALSLGLISGL